MSKDIAELFKRATRYSESDGSPKTHYHAQDLQAELGAATTLVLHGYVYAVSTTGRLDITASDTSIAGLQPRTDGNAVTLSGTFANITGTGPFRAVATGPFGAMVEITADVQDTVPATRQSVDFELHVTRIVE